MTDAHSDFRLEVRAQRPEDWESGYQIRIDPGVYPNVTAIPFEDAQSFRTRYERTSPHNYNLVAEAIFPDDTRRVVGGLGLHRGTVGLAHSADFGIHVSTAYQGKGVGSALMAAMCDLADNWLDLHRIELGVMVDNARAISLYKKFGFEIEATLPRNIFRNGVYVDVHFMGRINPRHTAESAQHG